MITVRSDLFNISGLDALAHGCNCIGVMGAGIAKEFSKRYPDMYLEYQEVCRKAEFTPGSVFTWPGTPTIFNLGTQFYPGSNASIEWVEQAVSKMVNQAIELNFKTIGMPMIGCGIGGLLWADVGPVIQKIFKPTNIVPVVAYI